MTEAWVPLAEITLGSASATVTFSSIPATYRDLILVGEPKHTSFLQAARIKFDTSTSYTYVGMYGSGSGSGSSNTFSGNGILVANFSNTVSGSFIAHIQDYSATDKHKTVIARGDHTASDVMATAGRWANTAAINQIVLFIPDGTSFAIGSTFALYGSNKLV